MEKVLQNISFFKRCMYQTKNKDEIVFNIAMDYASVVKDMIYVYSNPQNISM